MTLRKNVASQKLVFTLINATTGAVLTGATVMAKISLDGGSSITATGAVAELANGQYAWSPDAADTNATTVSVQFTATNAVPRSYTIYTTAANPGDAVRLGLTALPNANAEASGGLPTLSAAQASNGTINANVHRWLTGTPNALQSGRVDSYVGAAADAVFTAAKFAADYFSAIVTAIWVTASSRTLTAFGFTPSVTLAASQPNYAPAKAGDAMALTSDYDAAKTAAQPSDVTSARDSILSKLLKYFQLAFRKDAAIATDNATELNALNADGGSGAGAFANTTDSLEANRDNIGTAGAGLTAADDAVIAALVTLATAIDALPTNSELASALSDADDAVLSAVAALSIPTTAQIAAAIGAREPLAGFSYDRLLRIAAAVGAGHYTGPAIGEAGTGVLKEVGTGSTAPLVTAAVEANGDREVTAIGT